MYKCTQTYTNVYTHIQTYTRICLYTFVYVYAYIPPNSNFLLLGYFLLLGCSLPYVLRLGRRAGEGWCSVRSRRSPSGMLDAV